jgi:murein DD-endopeptidase MepM/ murein hydrolase activator NlpD
MFPLQHASKTNPEMGGWEYGDWSTYTNSVHAGTDFNSIGPGNADLGDPLIAVCTMRLENDSFSARGFGKHQWWSVVDGPHAGCYLHYAHADSFVFGSNDIGTIVHRGDKVGECGQSGGQQYVHLHFEVKRERPDTWGYWGGELKTKEAVDAVFMDPIVFCADYDEWADNPASHEAEFPVSPEEQSLVDAVRELGFLDHAENVIRVVAGLNANETSIEGWINEIGAIKSQLASLSNGSH